MMIMIIIGIVIIVAILLITIVFVMVLLISIIHIHHVHPLQASHDDAKLSLEFGRFKFSYTPMNPRTHKVIGYK